MGEKLREACGIGGGDVERLQRCTVLEESDKWGRIEDVAERKLARREISGDPSKLVGEFDLGSRLRLRHAERRETNRRRSE